MKFTGKSPHICNRSVSRKFNLNHYIRDFLASLNPSLSASGHRVTLCCDDKIEIFIEPGALAQVLTNLVDNALLHGLGLHRVYNLVTQSLNGAIICESQLGEGSSFILLLPESRG
jgi:signal transduction histidine kinase